MNMKYGILSTASIVERFVKGIRESKDGTVHAIASRNIETAKRAAKQLHIEQYYGSYEELYEDQNVDIVYIPTVNGMHYRNTYDALLHDKHVIVEKPFTLTSQQAKELFELAKKRHCFIMEAQKAIFLPTTLQVKKLLEEQVLGQIHYIELKAGFPSRFPENHWMYHHDQGGGTLYGSAAYTIELLQFLWNNPKMEISGTYLPCPEGADEICNFQLKLNDSILVSSTIAMNVALKNEAVIYGEKGYIEIPNYWKANGFTLHLHDQEPIRYDFPYTSEFVYEVEHIHKCISKGLLQSPIIGETQTMNTVQLVEELYTKWDMN